ncbi:MAG: hypothetical protein ACP5H3_03880 [Candidatus Aenigmatarchaeota archaeon]
MNVFKARHGYKISAESIYRALRRLREREFFITPPGMERQFFISEKLLQQKEVSKK